MEPIVIHLEPKRIYWQELYFINRDDTLLENPTVKYSLRYLSLCGVLLMIFDALYFYDHSFAIGLFGAAFFFLLCLVDFIRKLRKHSLWRRGIIKYLKSFENIRTYELRLSEEYLETIINGASRKEKWSSFTKVKLIKNGLRLYYLNQFYPIPQKAMSAEDFDRLFSFADAQIKVYLNMPREEEEEEEEEYTGTKW